MALKFAAAAALILLMMTTSTVDAFPTANKNCTSGGAPGGLWGWWWPKNSTTQASKKIVVGGSENWHFGFNYSDWAIKNGPFYSDDTLVFKYATPNATQPFQHSVYLLPDWRSYQKCDFRRATRIADVTSGVGGGFEFVLKLKMKWPQQQPWYYFACGEHDGAHCRDGGMKFTVFPMVTPRW